MYVHVHMYMAVIAIVLNARGLEAKYVCAFAKLLTSIYVPTGSRLKPSQPPSPKLTNYAHIHSFSSKLPIGQPPEA